MEIKDLPQLGEATESDHVVSSISQKTRLISFKNIFEKISFSSLVTTAKNIIGSINELKGRCDTLDTSVSKLNTDLFGYCTSNETYVGKWMDTNIDVYRKNIDLGFLPNATTLEIDVSYLGIDFVCGMKGIGIKKDKTSSQPFPYYNGMSYISCHYNNGKIYVICNTDFSLFYGRIIIEYAKS